MTQNTKKHTEHHKKNKGHHKKENAHSKKNTIDKHTPVQPVKDNIKTRLIHYLSKFKSVKGIVVTIIFMLLGVIVSNLFNSYLSGVPAYKLYIVGGDVDVKSDKSNTKYAYNFSQIATTWNYNETIDGKNITAEYLPDRWDENVASERAKEIAASDDAIMVIGHFSSTNTRKALSHYLSEEPPIPVLLTTETTPNLIPERLNEISEELPFFRLWPTDAIQAKNIAGFAADAGHTNFWVVEDRWANQIYSHYLAEHIVDELQSTRGKNVILWSHNQNLPGSNTLKDLEIDSIIFAGVASNALIFINQMEKIWKSCSEEGCKKPQLFLTDAAVDKDVLKKGLSSFEGKFITHPDLIACKKIDNGGAESSIENTTVIAEDVKEIFNQIIKRAKDEIKRPFFRQILGIHSVTDVRRAIATVMSQSKIDNDTTFGPIDTNTNKDKYEFNKKGINLRSDFKLWKVHKGMFVEYRSRGDKLEPVSNCPQLLDEAKADEP